MKLSMLIEGIAGIKLVAAKSGGGNPDIQGLACDSRQCATGWLFIAVEGNKDDGAAYLADAVARGAVAVLTTKKLPTSLPQLLTGNVRLTMAQLAAAFYDMPSHKMGVLGITGTCGKTTVAYLLRHIFRACGKPCGMLGTVEYDLGAETIPSPLTTPQSVDFQKYLAQMVANGAVYCAAEASSHALHQKRVAACAFAGAVFTNLSHEHLDYHRTLDEYASAKKILFDGLGERAVAVVNVDDPRGIGMLADCAARKFRYGTGRNAEYRIGGIKNYIGKTEIVLHYGGCQHVLISPLEGAYNVYNVIAAVALAAEIGLGLHDVAEVLPDFPGVPGRLEGFNLPSGCRVLVDYAHKPDALEKVLQAVRPLVKNKLYVVFGCGGDRDRGKRPVMGEIACALADEIVVTSDNPRTEDPQTIIDEIMVGCQGSQGKVQVESDRRAAIHSVLNRAKEGDIVLIAGKGHENYQIIGDTKTYFDDREVVKEFLSRMCQER